MRTRVSPPPRRRRRKRRLPPSRRLRKADAARGKPKRLLKSPRPSRRSPRPIRAGGRAAPPPAEEPMRRRAAAESAESGTSIVDTLKGYWWVLAARRRPDRRAVSASRPGGRVSRTSSTIRLVGSLPSAPNTLSRSPSGDTQPLRATGREAAFVVEESGSHERPRFGAEPVARRRSAQRPDGRDDQQRDGDQSRPGRSAGRSRFPHGLRSVRPGGRPRSHRDLARAARVAI